MAALPCPRCGQPTHWQPDGLRGFYACARCVQLYQRTGSHLSPLREKDVAQEVYARRMAQARALAASVEGR